MIETPWIESSPAQHTAVIRLTIPRPQIVEVMGPGITEVMGALAAQGLAPAGSWFCRHFRMSPDVFDFEISVPVSVPVKPAGRVRPSMLPAANVVRTIYRGPYEGLPGAWGEFDAWIEAHGHRAGEELWECYLSGPESDPDPSHWHTQLNRPLAGG